jgi:site-specific recombinase XerD
MSDFFKAVRDFILDYLPKQRCFSENTIKSYRTAINLFVEFLRTEKGLTVERINFSVIDRSLVIEFLNWLESIRNCSVSSRNHRLMVLRSFFEYAGIADCTQVALQLDIKDVPVKNEPGRIVEFLTEPALEALLKQPDTNKPTGLRDQFFMVLMYDTAARCSELLNMRIGNLQISTQYPSAYLYGKGDKPRSVPLLNKTVEHCKRYLQAFHPNSHSDDYLFYTIIHGTRHQMSADCVARFMQKYGDAARSECPEVPQRIHPHQLRHTRAIHYYRDGMPLVLVAEQLGHASAETTKIYAYADTEMKRAAMEKADSNRNVSPAATPIWQGNEEMILKLSGLR